MKPNLVVASNGMAGIRVVEILCRLVPDQFHITVIDREPRENYNRIQLSPVLGGEKTFDQTVLHPRAWYRDHHVCLLMEETVTAIDPAQRTLTTFARELHWQQLILANGSRSVMPPIPGIDLPHVCGFRTLDDVQHMLAVDGSVVVVGSSLLGIEVRHATLPRPSGNAGAFDGPADGTAVGRHRRRGTVGVADQTRHPLPTQYRPGAHRR